MTLNKQNLEITIKDVNKKTPSANHLFTRANFNIQKRKIKIPNTKMIFNTKFIEVEKKVPEF